MDENIKNNTIESIVQVKKLISENNIPIWLDGGTLLGWARHCGVVSRLHNMQKKNLGSVSFFLFFTIDIIRAQQWFCDIYRVQRGKVRFGAKNVQRYQEAMVFVGIFWVSLGCATTSRNQRKTRLAIWFIFCDERCVRHRPVGFLPLT